MVGIMVSEEGALTRLPFDLERGPIMNLSMSRRRWLTGLLFGLGALATLMSTKPLSAQGSRTLSAADDASIRAIVSTFASSWEHHDMDAMHAIDTEDVEWVNVTGNHWRGKANVRRGHTNLFRTFENEKANLKVDQALVRLIAPGVAIAVTTMQLSGENKKAMPMYTALGTVMVEVKKTRGSFVLVKRGKSWKIVQFQNTLVDPLAEKNDPVDWDKTGFDPRKGS